MKLFFAGEPLEQKDWPSLFWPALVIGCGFALFHILGNTADAGRWGNSAVVWMVQRWQDSGIAMGSGDYSHGFLVPLASAYLIWRQRDALILLPKKRCAWALLFVVGSLLLHYLGVKMQQTRLSLVAMIGLIWSIPFYLMGWQVARRLLFPCAFLIFAVPLNFLEQLTNPLRHLNSEVSVWILNGLGMEVQKQGTAIIGPPFDQTAKIRLDVADPCSGIRSLTAMMALTAVYSYLAMKSAWRAWALFFCSIPLAMAGNIFRIVSIGILSFAFDSDLAAGLPHDYAGFLVFGMAIFLMVMLGILLNRDWSQRRRI